MNDALLNAFAQFSAAQIASGDIDPMYPTLKRLYAAQGLDRKTAMWRTFLFMTWYDIGSANAAWKVAPEPARIEGLNLPTGIERRRFRARPAIVTAHVDAMLKLSGGDLERWVLSVIGSGGAAGWTAARRQYEQLPWSGNWSSYKWTNLLLNVHDFPLEATDIGVGGGREFAGPIPGMVRLTGQPWKACATDVGLQRELLVEARRRGSNSGGLDQLETALCDFNSLCKGHYYVGHDIDSQQSQLLRINAPKEIWEARQASFPRSYLGEFNGWTGVDKALNKMFSERGVLITR